MVCVGRIPSRMNDTIMLKLVGRDVPPITPPMPGAVARADAAITPGRIHYTIQTTPDGRRLLAQTGPIPGPEDKTRALLYRRYELIRTTTPRSAALATLRITPMPDGLAGVECSVSPMLNQAAHNGVLSVLAAMTGGEA